MIRFRETLSTKRRTNKPLKLHVSIGMEGQMIPPIEINLMVQEKNKDENVK